MSRQSALGPVLGLASSLFLAISFVLCVLGYLLFPSLPVAHGALSLFLPGFQLLTWPSFALGLVESIAWGWYVSLIFAPLFNHFQFASESHAALGTGERHFAMQSRTDSNKNFSVRYYVVVTMAMLAVQGYRGRMER